MSAFACEVVRLKIEPHPNADAIEIARIGDYQSIVKKGQFKDGDLGVYIPEQAVLPEWLLREMGFWDEAKQKGTLHGAMGNRVKAIKLRGVLSQGIVLALDGDKLTYPEREDGAVAHFCTEGEDVAEFLSVVKYEPTLPAHMRCRVVGVDYDNTHNYDFDNLKKKPDLFEEGEMVVITEKIHGTFMQIGVVPSKAANDKYYKGRVLVSSKGMGAKGFVLDHTDESNLYAQAAIKHGLLDKALDLFGKVSDDEGAPIFLLGEVFGKTPQGSGIQDLTYTDEAMDFRAFDICLGNRGKEDYMPWPVFASLCRGCNIPHVPNLYVGPYSKEVVQQHTDGPTTLTPPRGKTAHIREGVVVKSLWEDRHPHFGRKIAKSVSEHYLLRKGNATEFN